MCQLIKRHSMLCAAVLMLSTCALSGCGEVAEAMACADAAKKTCAKAFDCYPYAANWTFYGSQEDCVLLLSASCSESEVWTGCDVSPSNLNQCANDIDNLTCPATQIPASCSQLLSCDDVQTN
jgi:hypothetical protein